MSARINGVILVSLAVLASVVAAYLIATTNIIVGPLIILGVLGLFTVAAIVVDFRIGVYIVFLMGAFMFYVTRIITVPIPLGTLYDALVAFTFAAVFLNHKKPKDWTSFNNAITFFFIVITVYQLLQLFNPNAVSVKGWLVSLRNNTSLLFYITLFQMFAVLQNIKRFTYLWIGVAVVVALYGMYQEYVGLTGFEWRWIYEAPGRFELYFQWGSMRKFSFLSDPSAYGLFLAASGLSMIALAFGPYKPVWKFLSVILAIITFVAMAYSGTRTATAMVAVGFVLLTLLNINSMKVIVFAAVCFLAGAAIIFGPFHNATVIRLRSTFAPSDDPSMGVRDYKRLLNQSYIISHPIGGGLMTTGTSGMLYSPGHPLAGGWDPDSGYLATGLELGWIGLIIFMAFFGVVMVKGVDNHFALADPLLRNLNLAYIVPFFALSVGHYAQHAMFSKPINLIVIATYALLYRLPQLDKLKSDKLA